MISSLYNFDAFQTCSSFSNVISDISEGWAHYRSSQRPQRSSGRLAANCRASLFGARALTGRSPRSRGQTAPGWPSLQRLLTHQARHPLSAAPIPPSQHIRPHPPDTAALTTLSKTTTNLADQHLIIPGPLTRRDRINQL